MTLYFYFARNDRAARRPSEADVRPKRSTLVMVTKLLLSVSAKYWRENMSSSLAIPVNNVTCMLAKTIQMARTQYIYMLSTYTKHEDEIEECIFRHGLVVEKCCSVVLFASIVSSLGRHNRVVVVGHA